MTFLPIVDRELRVAARQRFTFWSRIVAATLALIIFGLIQAIIQAAGGMSGAGQVEFAILKWAAFIFAAAAGLLLTSDTLSEEIREGTLGLLFLTDLRGYDVVLGKMLTQSLRAFYGLLAAFPIMGLALLAGGVTVAEFWRSLLVICNTLLFSLSLGMLVSSISRDSTRAMSAAFLFGIVFFLVLPFIDFVRAGFNPAKVHHVFGMADPAYLFTHAGAYRFPDFWPCLLIQNALAWAFLIAASLRAPRAWQEKSVAASASRPGLANRWRFGGPRLRLKLRRRLLAVDPLLWLALRDRWLPRLIWTLAVIVALLHATTLAVQFDNIVHGTSPWTSYSSATTNSASSGGKVVFSSSTTYGTNGSSSTAVSYGVSRSTTGVALMVLIGISSTVTWLFYLALYLWIASQAARFFVDAVRNGAMELLLVAPVNPAQIIRAQWFGLCRTYWFPVLSIALLRLAGGALAAMQTQGQGMDMSAYLFCTAIMNVLTTIATLAAVAWYGMWMGLTNNKTSIAVLKTICYVIILPGIALWFVRIFAMFGSGFAGLANYPGMMLLLPALLTGVLVLCKDGFFIWLARRNFRARFRDEITRDRSAPKRPPAYIPPPPVMTPPPLPPLIPAT